MGEESLSSILVIGTDLHFCYLMRRYVRESDHPLLFSEPNDQVVELVQREKPALIVLEADMPGTEGRQVLKSLKGNPVTCQYPVALCLWNETELPEQDNSADIYMRMPILFGDFLGMLTRLGI